MRTISQSIKEEKEKLETSAILTLIEIQISDDQFLPLHMGDKDITYDGELYEKWNIGISDVTENIDGTIDTLDVAVGNVSRAMQSYVEANNGLRGNRIVIKQIYEALLNDNTAFVSETYYIMSTIPKGTVIMFSCTSKFDQAGIRLPLSRSSRLHCDWEYNDVDTCDWSNQSGSLDTGNFPLADATSCDKGLNTPNGCKAHLNSTRPRMFQGIPEGDLFV